jgi:hypothetical protein
MVWVARAIFFGALILGAYQWNAKRVATTRRDEAVRVLLQAAPWEEWFVGEEAPIRIVLDSTLYRNGGRDLTAASERFAVVADTSLRPLRARGWRVSRGDANRPSAVTAHVTVAMWRDPFAPGGGGKVPVGNVMRLMLQARQPTGAIHDFHVLMERSGDRWSISKMWIEVR